MASKLTPSPGGLGGLRAFHILADEDRDGGGGNLDCKLSRSNSSSTTLPSSPQHPHQHLSRIHPLSVISSPHFTSLIARNPDNDRHAP
jgi:hypothetical protein